MMTMIGAHLAAAQSNDSLTYLHNVWTVSEESVEDAARYGMEKIKKSNPAVADQIKIEMVMSIIRLTTIEFKSNGEIVITTPQGKETQLDSHEWKIGIQNGIGWASAATNTSPFEGSVDLKV